MFSLCPYLVQVTSNGKKLDLTTLTPAGQSTSISIFEILKSMMDINSKSGPIKVPTDNKLYRHFPATRESDGSVHGIIESGEFGYGQEFVETQTNASTYTKKKTEAAMLPFYYRISPLSNPFQVILVCQKFKSYGIKSHLLEEFGREIKKIDPTWILRIEKIVPTQLINRYLSEGEVKTIRLISYNKPSDVAESLKNVVDDENCGTVELAVKAQKGKSFKKDILAFVKRKTPISGLVVIPNLKYDTIKADIEIGGKRKSINLSNLNRIGSVIDITDDVIFDKNGHPTLDSLLAVSGDLIAEIKKDAI